jgi:hypothetical protein
MPLGRAYAQNMRSLVVAVWSKLLTGIARLRRAKKPASEGTEAVKEGSFTSSR